MSVRFQTWFPFHIQVFVNGREWLSQELDKRNISYIRQDNCFTKIDNIAKANTLLKKQVYHKWEKTLNGFLFKINPIHDEIFKDLTMKYYWTVHQSEWATDILFKSPRLLSDIYPNLVNASMINFSSPDIMRFLGKKLTGHFQKELISDYKKRPEGVRVKYRIGSNSIKMYDKRGSILRIETTINESKDFKIYRKSSGKSDSPTNWKPLRKSVYDIERRVEISQKANERYLDSLGASAHLRSN